MTKRRFIIGIAVALLTCAVASILIYQYVSSPIRTYEKIYLGMPRAEADAILRPNFSTSEPKGVIAMTTLDEEGDLWPFAVLWYHGRYGIWIESSNDRVTGKRLVTLYPSLFERVRAWLGL